MSLCKQTYRYKYLSLSSDMGCLRLNSTGERLSLRHTLAEAGVTFGDVLTLQVRQTSVVATYLGCCSNPTPKTPKPKGAPDRTDPLSSL